MFVGRQPILELIERLAFGETGVSLLSLQGPRGMGKSTILARLPFLLEPHCATVLLTCQDAAASGDLASSASFLFYLSQRLREALHRCGAEVEPCSIDPKRPFGAFDDWLTGVRQALPESSRVLICLDHAEALQGPLDAGWGAELFNAIRAYSQHWRQAAWVMSSRHPFAQMGPAWTSAFIGAHRRRVSFLERDEAEDLLMQPVPGRALRYVPGALETVIEDTGRQPLLLQAVAFELVRHMDEQRRSDATGDDVEDAVARAMEASSEYFLGVWRDIGSEGQALLRALAAGDTLAPDAALQRTLREQDVLDDNGSIAVPMLRRWILKGVPVVLG